MKVEVIIDDKNVYVRCDCGEWKVTEKSSSWLWVLGALHDGTKLIVKDEREILQDHQHKIDFEA